MDEILEFYVYFFAVGLFVEVGTFCASKLIRIFRYKGGV
jgi:hypothetical protein